MDLFDHHLQQLQETNAPLAACMRPRTLDEFVGQNSILTPGRLLRRAIQADQLSSLIFYGPPGTGKTTLARIIANTTRSYFIAINAVLAGVKELREAIASATNGANSTHGVPFSSSMRFTAGSRIYLSHLICLYCYFERLTFFTQSLEN